MEEIKQGDKFILGKNILMCGNSLKLTDVQSLLNGQKADMMFTDPPYNIGYNRTNHEWNHDYKSKVESFTDTNFDINQLLELIHTGIVKGAVYLCCGQKQIGQIHNWVEKNLKKEPRMLIWYKNNMSISRSHFHRRYETIMYYWYEETKRRGDNSDYTQDVWFFKNRNVSKYVHPTQKPVALIQKAIEISSDKGDIVLDLFGGSGSTLIACENTDRRCYMMELDSNYVKIIIERWEARANKKAEKVNDLIKVGV
jgi:DNA modification methylase